MKGSKVGLIGVAVVGVLVLGGLYFAAYRATGRTVTALVTGKERVCESGTVDDGALTCKYLVFTEAGTFEITDTLGRWNSSDVYGRMREGSIYRFDVLGWRFGPSSMYPNIVSDPVLVKR